MVLAYQHFLLLSISSILETIFHTIHAYPQQEPYFETCTTTGLESVASISYGYACVRHGTVVIEGGVVLVASLFLVKFSIHI